MAALKVVLTRDTAWAPTVGQFRAIAKDIEAGNVGQMTAEESWERICKYIQHEQVALTAHEKRALNATKTIFDLRRSECLEADRKAYKDAYAGILKREREEKRAVPEVKRLMEKNGPQALEPKTGDVNQLVAGLVGKMEG